MQVGVQVAYPHESQPKLVQVTRRCMLLTLTLNSLLLRTTPSTRRFILRINIMESSSSAVPVNTAQKLNERKKNQGQGGGSKLRGRKDDSPDVQLSKTLSWILRHGAQSEGLTMRPDGYAKVDDLVRASSHS